MSVSEGKYRDGEGPGFFTRIECDWPGCDQTREYANSLKPREELVIHLVQVDFTDYAIRHEMEPMPSGKPWRMDGELIICSAHAMVIS